MTHASVELKKILSNYLDIDTIFHIWEIGSRDGEDAKQMIENFRAAKINSFEPNVDTFDKLLQICDASDGRIIANNFALSDTDGDITFYKIDTNKTETTWPDGNPGASSIFQSNGEYQIEKYVQIPVSIKSRTGRSLIKNDNFPIPGFIWMDVQGAESVIIQGLGEYLCEVESLYIELSLKPVYAGQSLAPEVIDLLSKEFYWHSNLSTGNWQFDALFINKRHRNFNLIARNFFLNLSLRSNIGIFIKENPIKLLVLETVKKFSRWR